MIALINIISCHSCHHEPQPLDLPFSSLSFMKSLPALRWCLLLALLLLNSSGDTAVALCVKEGDVVAIGREEYYKKMHELHVKMEMEEEDYSEDYLGDVMEPVDFPDEDDDDEDSDGISRGSGKRYLRLLRGHGVVLCPHLQEYLERLERS